MYLVDDVAVCYVAVAASIVVLFLFRRETTAVCISLLHFLWSRVRVLGIYWRWSTYVTFICQTNSNFPVQSEEFVCIMMLLAEIRGRDIWTYSIGLFVVLLLGSCFCTLASHINFSSKFNAIRKFFLLNFWCSVLQKFQKKKIWSSPIGLFTLLFLEIKKKKNNRCNYNKKTQKSEACNAVNLRLDLSLAALVLRSAHFQRQNWVVVHTNREEAPKIHFSFWLDLTVILQSVPWSEWLQRTTVAATSSKAKQKNAYRWWPILPTKSKWIDMNRDSPLKLKGINISRVRYYWFDC